MPRQRLSRPTYRTRYRRGRWFVDYTDPATGSTRSVSTGLTDETDTKAAEVWRDQFVAARDNPPPPPAPRIAEILEGYQKARSTVQAPHTLGFCIKALCRHVGNLEPEMLAPRAYIEAREKEGVKDGTIRREIGVLRAALSWALKEKWLTTAQVPLLDAPPVPEPRDRWLTRDEVAELTKAAYLLHLKVFVVLAYHTAARKGAIFDLTWDRVDFDKRVISYDRPGRMKSKKRRATVPMNTVVLSLLQTAYEVRTTDYVVEWRGAPVHSIRTAFDDACERAGIAGCSPHVLRHTSATHMVMAGVKLAEIARFLGDTEAMVERVYGHHAPDYLRGASDALLESGLRKIENVAGETVGTEENVAPSTETLVETLSRRQKPSITPLIPRKISR